MKMLISVILLISLVTVTADFSSRLSDNVEASFHRSSQPLLLRPQFAFPSAVHQPGFSPSPPYGSSKSIPPGGRIAIPLEPFLSHSL